MAMWQRGQAWRVVNSLQTLNAQLRALCPRAVPPATPASAWGSIADSAHSSSSDHYPHFYPALGSTAVVCARDFPHAPALGMDGGAITEALRRSRDSRIAYVIFNGRIFSSTTAPWTWRPYSGSDRHDTHFHVSTVHSAGADNAAPWALPGATAATEDDVQLDEKLGQPIYIGDQTVTDPNLIPPHGDVTVRVALASAAQDARYARLAAASVRDEVRALRQSLDAGGNGNAPQEIDYDRLADALLRGVARLAQS